MITFDGIIFTCRNRRGGISVYFRELVRHAARQALEMGVLVHDPKISSTELSCKPEQLVFRRPRVLERFRAPRAVPGGLLHSSYYRTSLQRNVSNVVTVYDFTYEKFTSGVQTLVHARQKYAAIRRAKAVLCISENTRRDLLELLPDCPADKVFVTHLAAGSEFAPIEPASRPDGHRPFALFVSGRSTYKNFRAAVEAVRLVPDLELVCVGGGPFSDAERSELERALPGRYSHAAPAGAGALNELYNSAVCLLYPSLYEGFGIPLLEAMRAGCPFIALNRSSVPEVAGPAGILLQESDPAQLAAAIKECAQPQRRAQLRERGLTQAEKFSWDKTAADTFAVYRTLLQRKTNS